MRKSRKLTASSSVPIVGDGAIATNAIGEGRMVPVLIVDCSEKVELRDLIYAHEDTESGDVSVRWTTEKWKKDKIILLLEFSSPSVLEVFLKFDVKKYVGVIDGILHANALYLQPEESGKKVSEGMDNVKILVEIPDTGFLPAWEKIYTGCLTKVFKKSGFSKAEAKKAVEQHKTNLREIWSQRMNRN